jgi:hypothetical protein
MWDAFWKASQKQCQSGQSVLDLILLVKRTCSPLVRYLEIALKNHQLNQKIFQWFIEELKFSWTETKLFVSRKSKCRNAEKGDNLVMFKKFHELKKMHYISITHFKMFIHPSSLMMIWSQTSMIAF